MLVGFAVFSLERKLPQKKMLMLTGVMVTWVLVVMVGTTVQIMQTVGWLPVTPIAGLRLPYWSGVWFGVYPTWEGVLLQLSALRLRDRQLPRRRGGAQAPPQPGVRAQPPRSRTPCATASSRGRRRPDRRLA